MNPNDPNLKLVEEVAAALGPLLERLVLVGGAAAGFLITDPGQPRIRATDDVDVIVAAVSLTGYYDMEREIEALGFKHDKSESAPICRWIVGSARLDLMPANDEVLGFANKWYPYALQHSWSVVLPNGVTVRVIDGPSFVATKLEAFDGRGAGDYRASHDMEDIIAIIDGRSELISEIQIAPAEMRDFLARRIAALLAEPRFMQALSGHLPPDAASQARLPGLEVSLRAVAALGKPAP